MRVIEKVARAVTLVGFMQVSTPVVAAPVSGIPDLYAQYCSVCHGEKGDGNTHASQGLNPPPRDFTVAGVKSRLNRDAMVHVVNHGKPGTAMSGWENQLSSDEVEGLVDYIRTQFMGETPAGQPRSGKAIYASTCSVCHGEDGAGARWGKTSLNPPPLNFATVVPAYGLTRDRMIASVTHGRPGTAMTAFASQLSGREIENVVDHIRNTFMKPDRSTAPSQAATGASMAVMGRRPESASVKQDSAAAADFNLPMPNNLMGDAARGKAYYLQNCTACHGIEGNGNGPRAYFIFPKPRNFLNPANRARFNRPALFSAIKGGVKGREMPAWENVLSKQQIADIAEYVLQTFINPDAGTDAAAQ